MLNRAAADSVRPEGLALEFGLKPEGYILSDDQAQAILELRLQRLTGLEQNKIVAEYREVMEAIADLLACLEAGINVVSSAFYFFLHPASSPQEALQPVTEACAKSGASLFVSGIDPGWVMDMLPVVLSGAVSGTECDADSDADSGTDRGFSGMSEGVW